VEHHGHDDRVCNEPQGMQDFFDPVLQGVVDLARCTCARCSGPYLLSLPCWPHTQTHRCWLHSGEPS
jgi:hypothetical protein